MVLAASIYRTWCRLALDIIKYEQAQIKEMKVESTGNELLDTYNRIQLGVTCFVKSAFLYNNIQASTVYTFSRIAFLIHTLNGGFGLVVALNRVVEHQKCPSGLITFLHIYSLIWLLTIVYTLISLCVWFLTLCAESSPVGDFVVKLARSMDAKSPMQLPIFMTMARAFLLRDSQVMLEMKRREENNDLTKLHASAADMREKIYRAEAMRSELYNKCKLAEETEEGMVAAYKTKMDNVRLAREATEAFMRPRPQGDPFLVSQVSQTIVDESSSDQGPAMTETLTAI
jgi:hypothetical protein